MAKTPREAAIRLPDAGAVPNPATSSGEHVKGEATRCPHCGEPHPGTYSHCPRTGKPLQTGPALVGRVIAGRYRVTGILGEGGMGAVYIAEHLLLGRKVAIKRLHPELTGDEKAVARFQREARAAAATGHEHIVEVLDLGYAEDGAPYLVMEYLRGVSLAHVLKQEARLSLARTANIIGQVLAALGAVHQREIVHRDLKPDNVFLTRRGGMPDYVKVLDFGISKMKHEEGEPTNLTRTGVTMGTPYYMSPEQARGMKKLDHRVDLYAVAVMMYECLTGRLPLIGDNYHALLQQILRVEPIPPSSYVPGLPPEIDALLVRGLAKDPTQRFASATEMLEALTPFGARITDTLASTQPVATERMEAALALSRGNEARPITENGNGAMDTPTRHEARVEAVRAEPARAELARAEPARSEVARADAGWGEPGWPEGPLGGRESGATRRADLTRSRAAGGSVPAPPATTTGALEARARPSLANRVAPMATPRPQNQAPLAAGPRYFFAASEDWVSERGRHASPNLLLGTATPVLAPNAHTAALSASLAALPTTPRSVAAVGPTERLVADALMPSRDGKPARDEVSIKGSLVVALLDHLETELGSAGAAQVQASLEPALRQKLEGVILPMAWLPLGLFDAMLLGADRETEPARSLAAGRAAAERELSTTHRLFLQTATPASVLERLPHLHRVYFSRGEARVVTSPGLSRVELEGLGTETPQLVAWLSGFWQRMLEMAGAREVKIAGTTCRARGDERSSVSLRWR